MLEKSILKFSDRSPMFSLVTSPPTVLLIMVDVSLGPFLDLDVPLEYCRQSSMISSNSYCERPPTSMRFRISRRSSLIPRNNSTQSVFRAKFVCFDRCKL